MQLYDDDEYRASKIWPYAICAGCVVYRFAKDELEVLLLRRAASDFPELPDGQIDSYHLAKGHLKSGETLEQAALRETTEEAGVIAEIQTYLGASMNEWTDHQAIKQQKTVHFFAAQWLRDLDKIDAEHSGRRWLPYSEAIKLIGTKNPKREDRMLQRLHQYLQIVGAL